MFAWNEERQGEILNHLCRSAPFAAAEIRGDRLHKDLIGTVSFYPVDDGTLVVCAVEGLPFKSGLCGGGVFGFHIHSGERCVGSEDDPFAAAGDHYNPNDCEHPFHAGDLPPLFSNHGFAWQAVFTDRFKVQDIIGKTVIVHSMPDDFRTQPAGDSGSKIACGVIARL